MAVVDTMTMSLFRRYDDSIFFPFFLLLLIRFISGANESLLSSFCSGSLCDLLCVLYITTSVHMSSWNIFISSNMLQTSGTCKALIENWNWKWIRERIPFQNMWTWNVLMFFAEIQNLKWNYFGKMITNISKFDGNKHPKHNPNWMINLFRRFVPFVCFHLLLFAFLFLFLIHPKRFDFDRFHSNLLLVWE